MVGRISTIVTTGDSCTVVLFVDLLLLLLQHVGEELYHVTHPETHCDLKSLVGQLECILKASLFSAKLYFSKV